MIIGVTGTNGAGKGAVVEYLVTKGSKHYSVRAELIKEIESRGLPVDRSSMRDVGNELRAKNGAGYFIELFTAAAATEGVQDVVIESLRSVGEVEALQKKKGVLFAVDAERELRYKRTVLRGSETDKVDFDTWVGQEEREWHNTAAHDMNVPAVMALADYTLKNNGTLVALHAQVDAALSTLGR